MDIDVILDTRAPAHEVAALGVLAEQAGVRGVWVSSLLDSRDPFTNLSVLAQQTSTLLLGPVAVNPFDTHPVRIASGLLTLNELAGGRARLVVGGGGEALDALDIKPARRVRAVRECLDIIKAAATRQLVNYKGELYTVRNLKLDWPEAPAPPVYAGASMPQMLAMSARAADGIMMSDMPPSLAADAILKLDAALAKAGKSRPGFATNAFAAWHVYASREQALREARQWLVLRGIFRPWLLKTFLSDDDVDLVMDKRGAFWNAFFAKSPVVDGVPDRVLDALVENVTLAGSVDELAQKIDKLKAYRESGLAAISLRLYHDPAASIRLLGEKVIPALR